LKIL
jgi:hypothetical protein